MFTPGQFIDKVKWYNCWKTFKGIIGPLPPKKGTFTSMKNTGRLMLITSCFSAFNCTWRSCDSPRRPSTAAWQIDDSGAWIPRCSQTVLSVNNQFQREDLKTKRKGVWKWSSMLCASCSGSTNLSGSDLNVKVVPLVWNLEDFRPSKSVYPESVFVHQEPVGTHAQHDVHPLRVLQELKQTQTRTTLFNVKRIFTKHLWKAACFLCV